MADSPRRRYSSSPSPRRMRSRSRSRSPGRQHRGNNDAHNPGNTLYVTGLSTRVTEKELEDHFSREGKVVDCRLVVEPRTRISRGFAFITMENVEDAERCIKYLNQSILEGRYITVEKNVLPQVSWQQGSCLSINLISLINAASLMASKLWYLTFSTVQMPRVKEEAPKDSYTWKLSWG
ncbi:serine/arginine-rich splicing factor SR45a isoform X3 [Cryptomeria japonica]|uniref:serine/arginine-rich splicing factor SR45a isoform X3 n=1 Tax=Cryptomeria japonica TaxID=3369 RepID=UPI0025ACE35A|nr:serine/arginine-rich splicing factor SR45a isoform X3 [Cryptomeria japonica]